MKHLLNFNKIILKKSFIRFTERFLLLKIQNQRDKLNKQLNGTNTYKENEIAFAEWHKTEINLTD